MIKVTKPYNRLLRKRRWSLMYRYKQRKTTRAALNLLPFWHKWGLINYGYSKRKMNTRGNSD